MNEQYLRGYFNSYVLPNKPDAIYEDWVSKISTNEQYKQGMFNTYVLPAKPDADFADWNSKIFGGGSTNKLSGENPTFFQELADSNIPVISEISAAIAGGGKMVEGVIADQIPQSFYTAQQAYQSSGAHGADALISEYNRDPQKAIESLKKFEEAGLKIRNEGETYLQAFERMKADKITKAIGLEGNIQEQKNEFQKRTSGTVTELSEVGSAKDFMNWLGSSVGQAGGQIPFSLATFGAGSFLMESAEVYDQQVDLLADKYGISREEVIKRGLDDPAAGQAYAILAGALDAASAGSVMKLFKAAAGKEVKKSIINKALKASLSVVGEALTEGVQGQLETKGATVGADTEFEWNWKQFFNEAAAGAVGGGGLSLASSAFSSPITKEQINSIERESNEGASTGDSELDSNIDALAMEDAAFVDKTVNELLAKGAELEGAKVGEFIDELLQEGNQKQDQIALLEQQQKELERQLFLAEKLREFESSPVLPRNIDPISQANAIADEEALQNDISYQAPVQAKFELQDTEVPKYDPKTLDEIGTQKAKSFSYTDEFGGKASGKIVGDIAVLDEIFAAKDEAGNVRKGTNLYGKVLDELTKAKVKKLRVGMQSQGSQAALNKLVKEDKIYVDDKGGKDIQGNPIDFFIGKAPRQKGPKITKPKVKRGKAIPKPKPATKEDLISEEKPEVVDTKKQEESIAKKLEKEQQAKQDLETKLWNQLQNAKKRKLSAKISRFEELAKKAAENEFTELAQEAAKLADQTVKERDSKQELKEEAKELKVKRETKRLTKEQREQNKLDKKAEKEKRPENKKVIVKANSKLGKAFSKDSEVTSRKAQDAHYVYIAKAIVQEKGVKEVDKRIDEYNKYREDNKLKPVTKEHVLKRVEAFKTAARKSIDRQGRQNTIDKTKAEKLGLTVKEYKELEPIIKAAEARGVTVKEYLESKQKEVVSTKVQEEKKAKDAAKEDIKKQLAKELGVSPEDLDIGFRTNKENISEKDAKWLKAQVLAFFEEVDNKEKTTISKYKRNEISKAEYLGLAPSNLVRGIMDKLNSVIEKYRQKEGTKTKYYTVTVPKGEYSPVGGVYINNKKNDFGYLIVFLDEKTGKPVTGPYRNTILHEFLHEYDSLVSSRLYKNNQSFRKMMDRSFVEMKLEIKRQTRNLFNNVIKQKGVKIDQAQLSQEDVQFLSALTQLYPLKDIEAKLDAIRQTSLIPSIDIDELINQLYSENSFYAMTNASELFAELFSDQRTVSFLSQVKLPERITKGQSKGDFKSLLYSWMEKFTDWIKLQLDLTPVENNALDYLVNKISLFDAEFSNSVLDRDSAQSLYNVLSISNDKTIKGIREVLRVTNKEITKKITATLQKRKDIKTLEDVQKYVDRVNNRLPQDKQLGEDYARAILYNIMKYRKHLAKVKSKQKETIDFLKKSDRYKDNAKIQRDVDDMALVDLDELKSDELGTFASEVLLPLAYNNPMSKRGYDLVINYGKKKQIFDEMLKIAPKLKKSWRLAALSSGANAMTLSSLIGGYTSMSDKIAKYIYGGLMWANAKSGIESDKFWKELSTIAEKNNLTHKNLVKIGMYGGVFSTVNAPNSVEWQKEIKENAEHSLEAAQAKLQAYNDKLYRHELKKREIEQEISIAKELKDKIDKNLSMDNILSPAEKKIYDKIREFATKHEQDFVNNSKAVWDQDPDLRYNYFPTLAQGRVDTADAKDLKNDEILRGNADNLFEALDENTNYSNLQAKKVWSTYKRKNPKNYYYQNDALAIAKRWGKTLLFDIYASGELRTMNRVFKDQDFRRAIGTNTHAAFLKQIKSAAGSGVKYDPNVGDLTKGLMKVRDNLYTATLATSGQIALQAVSGFTGAAILTANLNPVKATKNFGKAVKAAAMSFSDKSKFTKLLEEQGLGIQLRDILFEKYLSPDDYRSTKLAKIKKFSQTTTELPIQSGDKLAARLVWFAAYFDAGGTIENPSKEAALKAERMVGLMQNMSDINFAAPMFKYDNVYKKLITGMFYAYKSFALNSFIAMSTAAPKVFTSGEARKVLASHLSSVLGYHALAAIAIRPLYKLIIDQIARGEDDEEEEKTFGKGEEIVTDAAWDAIIGSWAPSFFDQGLRYIFNETIAPEIWGDEYTEFNKYIDSPLGGPAKPVDTWKSIAGPGLREPIETLIAVQSAFTMQSEADQLEALMNDEDWLDRAETPLLLFMTSMMASHGYMPVRGDYKRIMEGVIREEKKRKAAAKGATGKSGTILDSETIEEIDYDELYEEVLDAPMFENFEENE